MFSYKRTAQYHETDKMGVIHHSNYIKWMEEARVAFMDELGLSYRQMEAGGIVSPVARLSVDYKRPVDFADEVELRLTVSRYTGAVLEFGYEIFDLTKGELAAAAASKHCFIRDGRPVSLKKALPELDARLRSDT